MFLVWYVYMFLADRSGPYDVIDDVITQQSLSQLWAFGAKYIGNEARKRDGFNRQPIGKYPRKVPMGYRMGMLLMSDDVT